MLKIGILNLRRREIGPKIFMRKLSESIQRNGYAKVTNAIFPFFDIAFFNSIARNFYHKKYILRLDGLFFDIKNTVGDNDELNRKIFKSLEKSKGIIFQSKFSKKLFERFYGEIEKENVIINNGSYLNRVVKEDNLAWNIPDDRIIAITVAHWRRHKRLQETVELFEELSLKFKQLFLVVIGPGGNISANKNILHIPSVKNVDIYKILSHADFMFHLSWLDNSPNSVVEALCMKIPVLCSNQGGTKELVEISNGGIVSNADKDFEFELVDLYNPPKPDMNQLYKDAVELINNLDDYKKKINPKPLDIDNVAKRYVEFAERINRTK